MSAIFTIARRDFMSVFSSMKGGAIFWFFLIFMGWFFLSFVSTFIELQNQPSGMMMRQAPTLEQLVQALFYNVHFILLFVIPPLTMSSFSEEMKTHTIRMLQTAPVTPVQIVLGKFFAAFGFMLLVLACSLVYPQYLMAYGNPDPGPIWSGYLGITLLIASQIALGIWVSSMTSNQLIALLATMFCLFLLLILNWLADSIAGGGTMQEFFKYVAQMTHLETFVKGMITVSSVTYFLCFTALFLFFASVTVDSRRWR